MPRNQITKSAYAPGRTDTQRTHIHVGWTATGSVGGGLAQVGVEIPLAVLRELVTLAEQAPFHGKPGAPEATSIVWADIDRDESNSLIRNVRTARDRAHGRDE